MREPALVQAATPPAAHTADAETDLALARYLWPEVDPTTDEGEPLVAFMVSARGTRRAAVLVRRREIHGIWTFEPWSPSMQLEALREVEQLLARVDCHQSYIHQIGATLWGLTPDTTLEKLSPRQVFEVLEAPAQLRAAAALRTLRAARVPEGYRSIRPGEVYLFTKSGSLVRAIAAQASQDARQPHAGTGDELWTVQRIDTDKSMTVPARALVPVPLGERQEG